MTKREMYSSWPAISAMAMMVVVSLLGTVGTHPVAMALTALIGVVLVIITIDTGGHSMLMFSAGFVLIALALTIQRMGLEGPLPWTAAALVSLLFADVVRMTFAERRSGVIESEVYQGVFGGFVVVAITSGVTIGLVAVLGSGSANGSWLLVPLALFLAVTGFVGLAIGVSKSPGLHDKRRWKPGERLMAPPRSAADDPSLKSSAPPS